MRGVFAVIAGGLAATSCQVDLSVEGQPTIRCDSNRDCPRGYLCRPASSTCARVGTNEPASLSIGAIDRAIGLVSIPVTVFDIEADPVDVRGELRDLSAATPTWESIALGEATHLASSGLGEDATLSWDAATYFGNDAWRSRLSLRLWDARSASPDAAAESPPFSFGNDPPTVTTLAVDTDAVGAAAGLVVVRFTLTDTADDPVAVVGFEVSATGSFSDTIAVALTTGRDGNFPSGALTGLSSVNGQNAHSLTWNSTLTVPLSVSGLNLRLTVRDAFGAEGSATLSDGVTLTNKTPPRVEAVYEKMDGGSLRNGLVPIIYRLIDEESDAADVRVEFTTDTGNSWRPCTEYRGPTSEGRRHLATAPGVAAGIEHVFIWDSTADILGHEPFVQVRMAAADRFTPLGDPLWTPITTMSRVGAGLPTEGPTPTWVSPGVSVALAPNNVEGGVVGHFNNNLIPDVAVIRGAGANRLEIYPGQTGTDGLPNGSFGTAASYAVSGLPRAVVTGDFNADTLADLAVANGNNVSVLLQGAGGAFAAAVDYPVGVGPVALALGDLDGDGAQDLVSLNASAMNLSVLMGQNSAAVPNGTFATAVAIPLPGLTGLLALSAADTWGDGCKNLAVVSGEGVTVLERPCPWASATPTFVATLPRAVGVNPKCIAAGDLDGDGREDFSVGLAGISGIAGEGSVTILFSDGPDGFAEVPLSVGHAVIRLAHADVTGDGVTDIVAASVFATFLLQGQGIDGWSLGRFEPPATILEAALAEPRDLLVFDLRRTGVLDVGVVERQTSSRFRFAFATTDNALDRGAMAPELSLPTDLSPYRIGTADLDDDGALDLVTTNFSVASRVTIHLGRQRHGIADGTFSDPTSLLTGGDHALDPLIGDFDNDGRLDLVVAHAYPDMGGLEPNCRVAFLRGSGGNPPTFSPPVISFAGGWLESSAAVDLNRDGRLDLLLVDRGAYRLLVALGNGDGTFATPTPYATTPEPSRLALGLFNRDLALDVVVSSEVDQPSVSVLLGAVDGQGRPTGAFNPEVRYSTGSNRPSHVAVADVNGDGLSDIVAGTYYDRVVTLRGLGSTGASNGTFNVSAPPTTVLAAPYGLQVALVNDDAVPDVLATQTDGFLVGLGRRGLLLPPGLWEPQALATLTGYGRLVADFNHDGALDFVSLNWPAAVNVATGRRLRARDSWTVAAPLFVESAHAGVIVGLDTAPTELDSFGAPLQPSLSRRPYRGEGDLLAGDSSLPLRGVYVDFVDRGRLAGAIPETMLIAGTPALHVDGDVRLTRVAAGITGDTATIRVRVEALFGPRLHPSSATDFSRAGLDLATGRGLVVELPLLPWWIEAFLGVLDEDFVVYLRRRDWTRADEWPGDPLFGNPAGHDYLPVHANGTPIMRERSQWLRIPRDDDDTLSTGDGPRFILDKAANGQLRLLVLTDQLGVFQGFLTFTP